MVPYEIPESDADLLGVGCVLTKEKLTEVWEFNMSGWYEQVARNRKRAADRRKATIKRFKLREWYRKRDGK